MMCGSIALPLFAMLPIAVGPGCATQEGAPATVTETVATTVPAPETVTETVTDTRPAA